MIKCFFFLISAFTFLIGNVSTGAASYSFPTDTHNTPIELKPASFENSYKTASVCFMGFGDCDPNTDYGIDPNNQCSQEGYIKNNCSSVQEPTDYCPYNKAYIKGCKCKTNLVTCPAGQVGVGASCGGKYASCQCDPNLKSCAANQVGSGASCGGRYQNCSCKPEYQFTSSNCGSPRSVSGASCGGKYNNCVCPSGVSAGAYGCKEYYPSPCNSVCKIAYTDNCHRRTSVSIPYGCMSYFSDCSSKCERAYTDNCRNRTAVSAPHGCQQAWGDCASKCQIAYTDNCRNRSAVSTPYGCQQAWSDCGSKCQIAYSDNCRNRTAESCSFGCASSFADCSSKCQTCNTDNCANRTAVATPRGCAKYYADCSSKCEVAYGPSCKFGDIYYSDGTCVAAAYHNSNKTALGVVVYVTVGGGQVMSPWYVTASGSKSSNGSELYWHNSFTKDLASLTNRTSRFSASQDFESCNNTDKIVKQGDSSEFPAAWAARNYAPTKETSERWCLPAAGIFSSIREFKMISTNMKIIKEALAKLGGADLPVFYTWSSTESTEGRAWYAHDNYEHGLYETSKFSGFYVRPVLEYRDGACDGVSSISIPENGKCITWPTGCPNICRGWKCKDGYVKSGNSCIKQEDPCDKVNTVVIPTNGLCTTWSPTCPSKCTGWGCKLGFVKSGTSCVVQQLDPIDPILPLPDNGCKNGMKPLSCSGRDYCCPPNAYATCAEMNAGIVKCITANISNDGALDTIDRR